MAKNIKGLRQKDMDSLPTSLPVRRREGSRQRAKSGGCRKVPLSLEQAKEVIKKSRWHRERSSQNGGISWRQEIRWYRCPKCTHYHTTSKVDRYAIEIPKEVLLGQAA